MNETKFKLFGHEVEVERASEPSDYVWENLHYTSKRQYYWSILVMIALFVILFIGYYV